MLDGFELVIAVSCVAYIAYECVAFAGACLCGVRLDKLDPAADDSRGANAPLEPPPRLDRLRAFKGG